MFKTENAHLVPNLLAKTIEEDEEDTKRTTGLLRDTTNTRNRACRFNKMKQCRGDQQSLALKQAKVQIDQNKDKKAVNQNQINQHAKANNFLINFDSSSGESELDEKIEHQAQNNSDPLNIQNSQFPSTERCNEQKQAVINKKNCFLQEQLPIINNQIRQHSNLIEENTTPHHQTKNKKDLLLELQFIDAEQQSQKIQEQPTKNQHSPLQTTINAENKPPCLPKNRKDFLLKLQFTDQQQQSQNAQEQPSNQSDGDVDCNKRVVIRLAGMLSRFQNNYHLQPIPQGAVFECVVKRDRCQSLLKYHLYDCVSLRNFMTIIKDSDGYLVICKQGTKGQSTPQKETVVGRIVSNFFGTQFNCTLQNIAYTRGYSYPITPKAQNVITIEYQTNLFGLKGPRKISTFIPILKEHKFESLNEVYERQKRKKLKPTVLKFKNKTPKWCKEINAYVLNFGGRASVSSIKNFVMVGQSQDEQAQQKVLFGKFGRQLFNLDIRYPFSILQGVCLAVSSFDRKLACQ